MWILDLLAGLFGGAGVPGGATSVGRNLSPAQNLAGGVGAVALPVLGFVLVLFAGLWQHPVIALVLLPAAFVVLSVALSARVGNDSSWTLRVALECAIASVISCGAATFLGALAGFYRDF
jgi:hypothetical protein